MELEEIKICKIWGAQLKVLSDAQAGRFIKAIYDYIWDGQAYEFTRTRPETGLIMEALEVIRLNEAQSAGSEKTSGKETICEKMSRSEIAKKAAETRWSRKIEEAAAESDAAADKTSELQADGSEAEKPHADAADMTGLHDKYVQFCKTDEETAPKQEPHADASSGILGQSADVSHESGTVAEQHMDASGETHEMHEDACGMHGMHEDADACMKHGMHDDA